jgi:hypothetical protein
MPDEVLLALTDKGAKAACLGLVIAAGYATPFADDDADDELGEPVDVLALPAPPLELPAPPVVVHEMVGMPVEKWPSVDCVVPGYPAMRVSFDMCTHDSGNRRAMTFCPLHTPLNKCRLEVFVKDFASREEAVSFLFAWRLMTPLLPDSADREKHIACKPDADTVAAVNQAQFG